MGGRPQTVRTATQGHLVKEEEEEQAIRRKGEEAGEAAAAVVEPEVPEERVEEHRSR